MNKKGVTLIELIVVMVIIAIGALLMAPGIGSWLPNYRLKSAARDIVSTMRTAQMKAVSNNVPYGVAFGTDSYRLYRSSGGLQPEGNSNILPKGIQFNNNTFPVNAELNQPYAEFNTNSTSSPGRVTLRNLKGTERRITLTPATARIKIE